MGHTEFYLSVITRDKLILMLFVFAFSAIIGGEKLQLRLLEIGSCARELMRAILSLCS